MKERSPILQAIKLVFSGVVAVGPLLGTLWLLYMFYRLLLKAGERMLSFVQSVAAPEQDVFDFPGIQVVYILLPLVLLFGVGVFAVSAVGRHTMKAVSVVMVRLPVIGFIYKSFSQFVGAIKELGGERKFKSVVYVQYPSEGCRLLGFVTGNFYDEQAKKDVTSVFVPTSPNPLTGFLLIVDDDKVEPSDMSVEQATKIVLSAGLVTPK